jgi:hypothetical protein
MSEITELDASCAFQEVSNFRMSSRSVLKKLIQRSPDQSCCLDLPCSLSLRRILFLSTGIMTCVTPQQVVATAQYANLETTARSKTALISV